MISANITVGDMFDNYDKYIELLLENVATLTPDIDASQSLLSAQSGYVYQALSIMNEVLKESVAISGIVLRNLEVKASVNGVEIFILIDTSPEKVFPIEVDSDIFKKNGKRYSVDFDRYSDCYDVADMSKNEEVDSLSLDRIRKVKSLLNKNFKKIMPFLGLTRNMLNDKSYSILYTEWMMAKVLDYALFESPISKTQQNLYEKESQKILVTLESLILKNMTKPIGLLMSKKTSKI